MPQGYIAWCHSCAWNLRPHTPEPVPGRLGALYRRAGIRAGRGMLDRLIASGSLEPRMTPARASAYVISAAVILAGAVLLIGGIVLIVLAFPNPALVVLGLLAAGVGWLMRPRFGRLERELRDDALPRAGYPHLFGLADEVTGALGTPRVDTILLTSDFNAWFGTFGLRRRRVLALGAPLLAVLSPQQRVALLAHEAAHGANGDARRSLVVGGAVGALAELGDLLDPPRGEGSGTFVVFAVVFWPLSRLVYAIAYALFLLLQRDAQRAEYQADDLGARVAGSEAALGSLEALHFGHLVAPTARRAGAGLRPEEALRDLAAVAAALPGRERERLRRVAELTASRLDDSHPPTAFRIERLRARRNASPLVVLDEARAAALDAELAQGGPRMSARLVDEARAALYY